MSAHRSRGFRLLLAGTLLWTTSCGTLIHPERVGQPRTGRLDTSVVLLNGIGLLLFLIPGVVAFIIDFGTGAIYLPPEYGSNVPLDEWRVVRVPPDEMTPARIQEVVLQETGHRVDLDNEQVHVQELQSLEEAAGAITPAK